MKGPFRYLNDYEGKHRKQARRELLSFTQNLRYHVNENRPHFIHEIKTIAYDVIDVKVFHRKFMRFHRKKEASTVDTLLLLLNGKRREPSHQNNGDMCKSNHLKFDEIHITTTAAALLYAHSCVSTQQRCMISSFTSCSPRGTGKQ